MDNNHNQNFSESNNLLEQEHSSTIIYNAVSGFSVNDNIFQTPHVNNNYYSHQLSNENIASTSTNSSYVPQYDQLSHSQPTTSSPFGSFNTTNINPSQTEILSFDIPGFKVIFIPQQDNTYSNCFSSNQFTQF
jgi:hypothetical protein